MSVMASLTSRTSSTVHPSRSASSSSVGSRRSCAESSLKVRVALLDQILEGKVHLHVLLGHRDHEAEVALYQLLTGSLVSGTRSPGERYLPRSGQQLSPPDPRQVAGEELWSLRFPPYR